jgi:hypothetical protein
MGYYWAQLDAIVGGVMTPDLAPSVKRRYRKFSRGVQLCAPAAHPDKIGGGASGAVLFSFSMFFRQMFFRLIDIQKCLPYYPSCYVSGRAPNPL